MYKTGLLKVKTQILQTIFAELPQTAKKVKLSIKFDDEQKLNTFKRLQAERQEDQQEAHSISSQSESEEEQIVETQKKLDIEDSFCKDKSAPKKQPTQKLRFQKIQISLEEGIIYKQFYEKQFEKIGQAYAVKIKIRAQKITFEGYDIQDIQQAMDGVKSLKDHIHVEYIPRYGIEISESNMIAKILDKIGVKIFRILDKYYRWYEISSKLTLEQQRQRKNMIKDSLRKIDEHNHCLQYLHAIEKDVDAYKGSLNNEYLKLKHKAMHYRPLLEELKGRIFQKELKAKMNEQSEQDQLQVELSVSKDALVFHSVAKQLMEMTIKDVKVQYQSYEYFFITIQSDSPIDEAIKILNEYQYDTVKQRNKKTTVGEIFQVKQMNFIHFVTNYQKVKQKIQRKMNDPSFCADTTPKQSVNFCIGFRRKVSEKKLEYLCEIIQKLQQIWGGASYKISILHDQPEQIQIPNVQYDFNLTEKLFTLTAVQTSIQTNLFILREYVIKKKLSLKKNNINFDNEENNITLSTINSSQYIQDSTYLNENSTSQDLNNSAILDAIKNQDYPFDNKNVQFTEEDQKCIKFLKDYKVYFAQTNKEYNEKYKDSSVKQNSITKVDKRNRPMEDQLSKIAECSFQVFKVQLNPKHKVQQFYKDPKNDQIVTVFISSKISPFVKPKQIGLKIQQGMNDSFPIRLFGIIKQSICQNGYLINIKKRDIEIIGKGFKVKYGAEFEVAKQIIYLKK